MSPENVEVVQAAYRAFNDTDEEALLNLAADGLVVESDMYLDEGPFYGRDAVSAYGEALREAFGDSVRSRPEEITEHGDHVLVMARTSATGKTSGAAIDARNAHVWTIQGGKIVRLQAFRTRDEALQAVGLRE